MQKRFSPLHLIISVPVIAAIAGSCALVAMSAMENIRFDRSIDQTRGIVEKAHIVAAAQQDFGTVINEDVIPDLQRAGQMASSDSAVVNGWRLPVKAYAMPDGMIRVDNQLPPHECRRMALYFIEHQPQKQRIVAIDGYNRFAGGWVQLYPASAFGARALDMACQGTIAVLGIVFSYR